MFSILVHLHLHARLQLTNTCMRHHACSVAVTAAVTSRVALSTGVGTGVGLGAVMGPHALVPPAYCARQICHSL